MQPTSRWRNRRGSGEPAGRVGWQDGLAAGGPAGGAPAACRGWGRCRLPPCDLLRVVSRCVAHACMLALLPRLPPAAPPTPAHPWPFSCCSSRTGASAAATLQSPWACRGRPRGGSPPTLAGEVRVAPPVAAPAAAPLQQLAHEPAPARCCCCCRLPPLLSCCRRCCPCCRGCLRWADTRAGCRCRACAGTGSPAC